MRSVVAVVTLALVAILCLPGAAQAGGPSAKGNKEAFVDLGPAIPVPPGLFTLSIKFSLNAQTTGKGTTKGHFNLEITEASAAAVGAFPFIEDGYAKAKPKLYAALKVVLESTADLPLACARRPGAGSLSSAPSRAVSHPAPRHSSHVSAAAT